MKVKTTKKDLSCIAFPVVLRLENCYDPHMDAQFLRYYSHAYLAEAVRVYSANRRRSTAPAPRFTMLMDKRCDLIGPAYQAAAGRVIAS